MKEINVEGLFGALSSAKPGDKIKLADHIKEEETMNEKEKEHIIWSNDNLDYKDWKEDLEEEFPNLTEDERVEKMYETNNMYLDDERVNLNIQLPRPIIVIGDIGRWDGRVKGYKEIKSGNIRDCLYDDCEYVTWFVDEHKDLRCTAHHHDGTNYYLYRTYRDNVSERQIENFKEKLYNGVVTQKDIDRITKRIGDKIAEVYGW